MKKRIFRVMLTALSAILLLVALVVVCSAEKTLVAEGYCLTLGTKGATETNVKWQIYEENGEQTIYFSIDASKGSENTVLHAKDRETGGMVSYWSAGSGETLPWGKYTAVKNSKVTKAVIGDGITEINGPAFAYSSIKTVEIPKTVVRLNEATFNRATKLDTVNITGEEENSGIVNLTYITYIAGNVFGGENCIKKYVFNPNYEGAFGKETFSKNNKLQEIEFPAGVTSLGNNLFTGSANLAHLTILGKTTVVTNETFGGLTKYPRIIGYLGSAVETFAKENGYTFIDIETNEVVHTGTKPLVPVTSGEVVDPVVPEFKEFDPSGSTAHGHMTGLYNGSRVVDSYWAYYEDTKTLKVFAGNDHYTETGRISFADDKKGWTDYLELIEHVVVGDCIAKLSNDFLQGMVNLKSVELSTSVTQMGGPFTKCSNLTTVYYTGEEKVEGLADFSRMKSTNYSLGDTKIRVLKLGNFCEDLGSYTLPVSLEMIITPYYNSVYFDTLCKESQYDLQDANNPANVKDYFTPVVLDPSWPLCGASTAFDFDETTGTLTVHGKGAIDDIPNYYGGGSKLQPWFSIRNKVKHIVIADFVNVIGKYAFAECVNVETVRLPNIESIEIMNGAFEKCYNLKSIYIEGTDPIEGTFDLRLVKGELRAWTFAYNYLVANVIVDESVTKMSPTTFEENLGVNLKGIYGVPGSFAEEIATTNGLTFYDISKGMPSAVTCTPPADDTTPPETGSVVTPDTTTPVTTPDTTPDTVPDTVPVGGDDQTVDGEVDIFPVVVIVVVVVLAVVACVVVLVIKMKKRAKNDKQ